MSVNFGNNPSWNIATISTVQTSASGSTGSTGATGGTGATCPPKRTIIYNANLPEWDKSGKDDNGNTYYEKDGVRYSDAACTKKISASGSSGSTKSTGSTGSTSSTGSTGSTSGTEDYLHDGPVGSARLSDDIAEAMYNAIQAWYFAYYVAGNKDAAINFPNNEALLECKLNDRELSNGFVEIEVSYKYYDEKGKIRSGYVNVITAPDNKSQTVSSQYR